MRKQIPLKTQISHSSIVFHKIPKGQGYLTVRASLSPTTLSGITHRPENVEHFAYQIAAIMILAPVIMSLAVLGIFVLVSLTQILAAPLFIGISIWVLARLLIKYGIM